MGVNKMKIYNIIDEQNRYCGFKVTTEIGMQVDSHTYSYLFAREQYKEIGEVMGLEKGLKDENI